MATHTFHLCCCWPSQVLSNIDELFDREELSAAPDPGWPDCFNSGVFVFRPSVETYTKLLDYCSEHGSFDGRLFCTQAKSWLRRQFLQGGKEDTRNIYSTS